MTRDVSTVKLHYDGTSGYLGGSLGSRALTQGRELGEGGEGGRREAGKRGSVDTRRGKGKHGKETRG